MIEDAALEMRVVPSARFTGIGSNNLSLLGLRGQVASERKRAIQMVHVRARKMNKTESPLWRREVENRVKTRGLPALWDKLGQCLFMDPSGARRRGGMILAQAPVWNVGTCRFDVKGKVQAEETASAKVPMRNTGTEQSVVAMKSSKKDGAKGLYYFRSSSCVNCKTGGTCG